jgi:hypothetical protein
MIYYIPEGIQTQTALTQAGMAILMAAKGILGIIQM